MDSHTNLIYSGYFIRNTHQINSNCSDRLLKYNNVIVFTFHIAELCVVILLPEILPLTIKILYGIPQRCMIILIQYFI